MAFKFIFKKVFFGAKLSEVKIGRECLDTANNINQFPNFLQIKHLTFM